MPTCPLCDQSSCTCTLRVLPNTMELNGKDRSQWSAEESRIAMNFLHLHAISFSNLINRLRRRMEDGYLSLSGDDFKDWS